VTEEQRTIGRYQLVEKIGRGSMGTVYRAFDSLEERHVALKLMAPELSGDPELSERFRREAQAAAVLAHPNITEMYDYGEHEGRLYMAMELLEGWDLKELVDEGRVGDLAWKVAVMVEVAAGVAFVHSRDLVHRDLKPGNIHITPEGRPKIMDFGLVRISDSNMTSTGMVLGSPSYMSPEQLRGEKADARSDVFSLGTVFYELLAGKRAFAGKVFAQILMNVITGTRVPLVEAAPDVPVPVAGIVERCLLADVRERYQTAGEVHAALEVARAVYGG
jgi:serine/threonine protein kinase